MPKEPEDDREAQDKLAKRLNALAAKLRAAAQDDVTGSSASDALPTAEERDRR